MHYYEKNIVEIKTEYTNHLYNIMTPLIYEGFSLIYNEAINMENKFIEQIKRDPQIVNPGVFKIFQVFVRDIPKMNNASIEQETNRIINGSKCAEWFENLVKAVIKSHIVLLTYNASEKRCKLVEERFHQKIDLKTFVHKCYIECAKVFYGYPELFWRGFNTLDIKRNKREAFDLIKQSIGEAIRGMLPIKLILDEYLKKDYITRADDRKYVDVGKLMERDLGNRRILEESDESNHDNDNFKIIDSDDSIEQLNDQLVDVKDKVDKVDDVDDLVLDRRETYVTVTEKEATSDQLKRLLNDPGFVREPAPLKKRRDNFDFGIPDQPKPKPEPKPNAASVFQKIGTNDNNNPQPIDIPVVPAPTTEIPVDNKLKPNEL